MERGEQSRGRGRPRKNPLKDIVAETSHYASSSRQVEDNHYNPDAESPVQNQKHSSPCGEEWNSNDDKSALRSSLSPKSLSKAIAENRIKSWGKTKRRKAGVNVAYNGGGTTGCAETKRREEDGAACSFSHSVVVNVKGYYVKQEVAALFKKITERHGDIGKDCDIECGESRGLFVEMMCSAYKKLEDTSLKDITETELKGMLAIVNVLQNLKFDVKWLYERLTDISSVKNLLDGKKKVTILKKENEFNECRQKLLTVKAELLTVKAKFEAVKVEFDTVNYETKSLIEKSRVFTEKSLVHGLV